MGYEITEKSIPVANVAFQEVDGGFELASGGRSFVIQGLPYTGAEFKQLLAAMDGERPIADIGREFSGEQKVRETIRALYDADLLYFRGNAGDYIDGLACLLQIEDLQAELMHKTLYQNKFWQACKNPAQVDPRVFHGMAIENFHFLFRESWFDSPVLSYQGSTRARLLMNEFYAEEFGHDELILRALNEIGITREQANETRPLPQTLALCHGLSHWAATDPLFFFTTLGVLEGRDIKIDSYIRAMEQSGSVGSNFIQPILAHANINMHGEHGSLTRKIFRETPPISVHDYKRLRENTRLFIEMYDDFHTAVWEYYSNPENPLLRQISKLI